MNLQSLNRRWVQALLLVGFWTLVALIYITSSTIITLIGSAEQPFTLSRALWTLLGWYTWIPSSLIVLMLVRRFPIDQVRGPWSLGVHLVAAPLVSFFASALFTGMRGAYFWMTDAAFENSAWAFLQGVFLRSVTLDSVIYMTILVGAHAFEYYRRYQDREVEAAQLERELAEARLHALRLQLQPHFLFNTFHTIAMLVRQQRDEEAIDTIAVLSEFLRYVLEHTGAQEVSLQQELDFLDSYLAIERIRFQHQLDVEIDVDDEALPALVPNLILQPLVENAIRHGIEPNKESGRIEVWARRDEDMLWLRVCDDGVGLPDDWRLETSQGIGLSNTKIRLRRLYGTNHRLDFAEAPGGGLAVSIALPYHVDEKRVPGSEGRLQSGERQRGLRTDTATLNRPFTSVSPDS